jgi:hypothetical protein
VHATDLSSCLTARTGRVLAPSYAWEGAEFLRLLHAIVLLPAQNRAQRSEDHLPDHGYKSRLRDFCAAWESFVGRHRCEADLLANPQCSRRRNQLH